MFSQLLGESSTQEGGGEAMWLLGSDVFICEGWKSGHVLVFNLSALVTYEMMYPVSSSEWCWRVQAGWLQVPAILLGRFKFVGEMQERGGGILPDVLQSSPE